MYEGAVVVASEIVRFIVELAVKNAFEPKAVVVAVPPFATGMTPVRESVVVEVPPEAETVEVIFPEPMILKLMVELEEPLKEERNGLHPIPPEDEKEVTAPVAHDPEPP